MPLSLKVEFTSGDIIANAFAEAVAIATKLDVCVEFKFNDVTCIAFPGGDWEAGAKMYHDRISHKYPVAIAR